MLTSFFTSNFFSRPWHLRKSEEKSVHPLLAQSREYFSNLELDRPLHDYEFVVLDTELTGLKIKKDEMVSIGAVRIREMRIDVKDSFYNCVCPSMEVPKQSVLIHGITPSQASKAPPLEEVIRKFLEYCGNSVIIGHNIKLDMGVINRTLKRHFNGSLHNICVDTMLLAIACHEKTLSGSFEAFDTQESYNLKYLSQKYNLPLFQEHNAFSDALQAAYLFLFLVHKLQEASTWTLKDLCRVGCSRSWALT